MSKELAKDLVRIKPKHPRKRLKLSIPHAPSVNLMYKYVRGRKILTRQAHQYMSTVQTIASREVAKQKYKKEEKGVWLILELTFYFPDLIKRDTHNTHKIIADALEGVCYENDQYVLVRDIKAHLDRDNPRVECVLYADKY